MKVVIVNEKDEELGVKEKAATEARDIYRVSALWLSNLNGEVLLARRALTMSHDPGKWGPAAAGTLEEGETYDSNMVKEIEEELGLQDLILRRGPKVRQRGRHEFFAQWYLTKAEISLDDIRIQPEEVAEVRWIAREELLLELKDRPDDFIRTAADWPSHIELFDKLPDPPEFVLKPGQRDYTNVSDPETLNCVISSGDRILLVKRNSKLKTYPGYWSTVTGYLDDEKSPIEKAKEELWEETAIGEDRILSFREVPMIPLEDKALGRVWRTHPVLAEIRGRGLILDWEAEDARWIKPEEVHNYKVVPGFERVLASFFKI